MKVIAKKTVESIVLELNAEEAAGLLRVLDGNPNEKICDVRQSAPIVYTLPKLLREALS
jgi:hypothetical protein